MLSRILFSKFGVSLRSKARFKLSSFEEMNAAMFVSWNRVCVALTVLEPIM